MPHELKRYSVRVDKGETSLQEDPDGTLVHYHIALNAIGHEANRAELLAEDIECLHMCLDREGVPRKAANGEDYSLWGRVLRFKDPQTPEPVTVEAPVLPLVPMAPLADICAQCPDSLHPDLCPTAYRSCPRMRGRS